MKSEYQSSNWRKKKYSTIGLLLLVEEENSKTHIVFHPVSKQCVDYTKGIVSTVGQVVGITDNELKFKSKNSLYHFSLIEKSPNELINKNPIKRIF